MEEESEKMKKSTCILLVFTTLALAAGIIIGLSLHFLLPRDPDPEDRMDSVGDCWPMADFERVEEKDCLDKGCVWTVPSDGGPWCTFPEGHGYTVGETNDTTLGFEAELTLSDVLNTPVVPGSANLKDLKLEVQHYTEDTLRIVVTDSAGERFRIPDEAKVLDQDPPTSPPNEQDSLYNVTLVTQPTFGVKVIRRSTGAVIFDTSLPGFTFSVQYMQLTTRLPSPHVYGFGEHNHRRFKHDMNWKKWAIFTRDVAPVDEWNLYGAQPYYMNLEEDGKANGVLLLNSNAMDVVLQPDPHPGITYHVIGGVLDFFLFLGPTPENVVQQYTWLTGRPIMPPYWSLGFQLCRWDYDNLTHVKHIVNRNRDAGIPQDVQYGDIDYMESKLDFTVDKVKYDGLAEFVDELHHRGQRYIVIQDHCIGNNQTIFDQKLKGYYKPYVDGVAADIFVKESDDETDAQGEVWPGTVVYPDFTNIEKATTWWTDQCEDFYYNATWRIEYDALWIDMNEPSNFLAGSLTGTCKDDSLNNPPYLPRLLMEMTGHIYDKTLCMDNLHAWGTHYDVHSLYGHAHSIVSWNALRKMFNMTRPLVLTRSQFTGSQKYAGHWLGDNQSLWEQIPWSIIGMLEYSLFGFSYTGADICGFWFATNEEMCQRWMQLGAFYPYARNHNGETWPDQDPAAFSDEMIRVSRDILRTRYKLLPFLYTLMEEAHRLGSTVVRPLLHEFPTDKSTWDIDRQFLWGPAFMISPVMEEGQRFLDVYFPDAPWYDYYTGSQMENTPGTHNLSTPMDKINLHVRGGHILPWQHPDNTTKFSRQNPMGMIVALGEAPSFEARGSLFWDDGESYETQETDEYLRVNFFCSQILGEFVLKMEVDYYGYPEAGQLNFETIDIWGVEREPLSFTIDDIPHYNFKYSPSTKTVQVNNAGLDITGNHTVVWTLSS